MISPRLRSWILALIGLAIGGLELTFDLHEGWMLRHAPQLQVVVEAIEMLLMLPGIALILFSLSEWRSAQARLHAEELETEREARFAMLGRLAACVAHEVRNPLYNLQLLHEAVGIHGRAEIDLTGSSVRTP